MTCREVFYQMHSDMEPEAAIKLFKDSCPDDFGYAEEPEYCIGSDLNDACVKCWNREAKPICLSKAVDYKDVEGEGITMSLEPIIKDSGNRREFESGAVRDMQEGKGRCDLMPLEIVSDLLGTKEINHDPVVLDIATFMYDHDTCWLAAALDNFASVAYGGCLYTMFLEVAKHFEEGAKKYQEDNWRLGIPIKCYIDSAVRHYMKWCRGDKDEPHDRAFCWNLMCCMWEVEYGAEWRKSGGNEGLLNAN